MDLETLTTIMAADVREGDEIVNIGTVNRPPVIDGLRVMVETYGLRYMPVSGRIERQLETHVYHFTDTLVVVQEG